MMHGETERILAVISKELGGLTQDVVVEGHTDSRPYAVERPLFELGAVDRSRQRRAARDGARRPAGQADHRLCAGSPIVSCACQPIPSTRAIDASRSWSRARDQGRPRASITPGDAPVTAAGPLRLRPPLPHLPALRRRRVRHRTALREHDWRRASRLTALLGVNPALGVSHVRTIPVALRASPIMMTARHAGPFSERLLPQAPATSLPRSIVSAPSPTSARPFRPRSA